MEEWRPINGYDGLYEVSNQGRVRSVDRNVVFKDGRVALFEGKVLAGSLNSDGYRQVFLSRNDKAKSFKVHRLVAEAFIPNPLRLPEINHIDEVKTNNCVENLEWCDHLYNSRHGTRGKRISENSKRKPLTAYLPEKPESKLHFRSMSEASEFFGVSVETVRQSVAYKWKCRGHILELEEKK